MVFSKQKNRRLLLGAALLSCVFSTSVFASMESTGESSGAGKLTVIPSAQKTITTQEFELDKAWLRYQNNPQTDRLPKLEVAPSTIMAINNHLVAKYAPTLQNDGQQKASSLIRSEDILSLLKSGASENLKYLTHPQVVAVLLNLLRPFHLETEAIPPAEQWRISMMFPWLGESLFSRIGLGRGKTIAVNMSEFLQNTYQSTVNHYAPGIASTFENKIYETLKDQVNACCAFQGLPSYKLPGDAAALSHHLTQFLSLTRTLYGAELKVWERLGPKLEDLTESYDLARELLDRADILFQGVVLAPYTVSVIPTKEGDKAEARNSLVTEVQRHFARYKSELDAYKLIKQYLPAMKDVIAWLEELAVELKRNGRIS